MRSPQSPFSAVEKDRFVSLHITLLFLAIVVLFFNTILYLTIMSLFDYSLPLNTLKKEQIIGKINKKQVEEIAKLKAKDLNTTDMSQAIKIIEGTARSMGVEIE